MQNRIDHLENLVTSFVSQTKGAVAGAFTPPSDATLQDIIPCTKLVDSAELEPDDFEANQLLDCYRVELTKQSPFVVITPGTTVLSLKRNSPFLYNAIIIATSNDYPSRQALYEEKILEFVTHHLLTRSNKNLELLQGILIFITWYKRRSILPTHLTTLLQLAIALVSDLNLNRGPSWLDKSKMILATSCSGAPIFGPQTMDERRALLGCFYLSSATSASFQRPDTMRFTRQIEESCQALLQRAEYPTDLQLVYVVKIQYLTDRITQTLHVNDIDVTSPHKDIVELHVRAFQSEIEAMRESLPPLLKKDSSILIHLSFATIRLHEIALSNPPPPPSLTTPATDTIRLTHLHTLLLSTASLINTILSLFPSSQSSTPTPTPVSISYITWTQFAYGLHTLSRLTFFTSPSCTSWSVPLVRSICDFAEILTRFRGYLEKARQSLFSVFGTGWAGGGWFESKVQDLEKQREHSALRFPTEGNEGMQQVSMHVETVTARGSSIGLGEDEMLLDDAILGNFGDEAFWLDLDIDWEDGMELGGGPL
ncbi:hypothetical protein B0J14DRAFT_647800 [Halenospora varia]|nr:hypothetical protein B0J14DRAFT_647800 [Halenospora varia]